MGKRETQNFRVGKDSFTGIHCIKIDLASPYDVPGITLGILEANRSKSLPGHFS